MNENSDHIVTRFIKLPMPLVAAVHTPTGGLQSVAITQVLVTFEAGRAYPSVRHVIGGSEVQFADQLDGFIDVLNGKGLDLLARAWSPEKCDCNRCQRTESNK
jgi:hypothetical protein